MSIRYFIYMLGEFISGGGPEFCDPQDELYFAAVKYLEERYAEKISLQALSHKLGYSVSYVCRIFKKKSGKTVFAFLDWLRLKKAAELLRTTRLSVTDIAYCTGFSDSNYFTNAFRKREGCSPSVYRKKCRAQD